MDGGGAFGRPAKGKETSEDVGVLEGLAKKLSHEKNHGWLAYIGDEILPSYIGIIINHEIRIPITNQDSMESKAGFFRGSIEYQNTFQYLLLQIDDQVLHMLTLSPPTTSCLSSILSIK